MEAFHVALTHPQQLTRLGDTNSRYDTYDNFSRSMHASGTPSPSLKWQPTEQEMLDSLLDVRIDEERAGQPPSAAIEDLRSLPLPPDGLWDPADPLPPEPPEPLHWRAFFETPGARDEAAAAIQRQFPDLETAVEDVPDENWAARSQRELHAIRAGSFIVAPPWDRPVNVPADVTTIVIEPSRGFGTGHHASTRLCLRALSELEVTGRRVLDLGTGSGVLAMAAALTGARAVLAVDADPDAIESARASASLNALPVPVDFAVSDFRESAGEA